MRSTLSPRTASGAPSTSRGVAALALAMLALVAQAGGLLHLVLVQHITCPEHGEWVHAEAGRQPAALRPVVQHHTPTVEKSAADEQHEHDHCSVTCSRRDEAVFTAQGVTVETSFMLTKAAAFTRAVVTPTIALLRLAPKASPPA